MRKVESYDTERKLVIGKDGTHYLVDFVFVKEQKHGPKQYWAFGYDTNSKKEYGWVELNNIDPIKETKEEAFVSYAMGIDKHEIDNLTKEYDRKRS